MDETEFRLKKEFGLKYLELARNFPPIKDFLKREFAFLTWDKNYMFRHIGYSDTKYFYDNLKTQIPRHMYASAAIYMDPSAKKMSDKGWQGCDFVIDIDADHMELPCSNDHNYHFCKNCSYFNNGSAPDVCPECGGSKFDKQLWLCDDCLDVSRQEVIKCINMLVNDFGFDVSQLHIKFSGHRGYHIEIYDDKIRKLSSDGRRQIVDYLNGTGFKPPKSLEYKNFNYLGTKIDDFGWRGKIPTKFKEILSFFNVDEFLDKNPQFIENKRVLSQIFNEKEYFLGQLNNRNENWRLPGFGERSWEIFIGILKDLIKCEVDIPVSIDIHRLLRLNGSIHGKTGFLVRTVDFETISSNSFDPFKDAILFSMNQDDLMNLRISTEKCPKIRIQDQVFGPYNKDELIRVPKAVGIFLACKGVANIVR